MRRRIISATAVRPAYKPVLNLAKLAAVINSARGYNGAFDIKLADLPAVMAHPAIGPAVSFVDNNHDGTYHVRVRGPLASRSSATHFPDLIKRFVPKVCVDGPFGLEADEALGEDGNPVHLAFLADPEIAIGYEEPGKLVAVRFEEDDAGWLGNPHAVCIPEAVDTTCLDWGVAEPPARLSGGHRAAFSGRW